jgi:hypothetical protein
MSSGDNMPASYGELAKTDELLWSAWVDFCDQLKEAGKLVFNHDAPVNELNRASGFEYLARYLPKALDQMFNCRDPLYPQLFWLQTPTSKSFGDNPDCTYFAGWVHSDYTYRLVGNRGSVKWVNFNVGSADIEVYKKTFGHTIVNDDLITEWDGSFEIIMSQEPHEGNWLQLDPGLNRVYIRQFYGNWDTETRMSCRIERVDLDGPAPPPTAEDVARRLDETMQWLREDSEYWTKFVSYYRPWPNQFIEGTPKWMNSDAGRVRINRSFWFCHWEVEPDEALIIQVRPPRCNYWNFEFLNEWMISMDYRYRISSINGEQAVYEDDGSVVIVVSHVDPGVPNWLDCGGYTSGQIDQRWVEVFEGEEYPEFQTKLVKLGDLGASLPANVRRIDPAGRAQQVRRRKIGVDKRFPV